MLAQTDNVFISYSRKDIDTVRPLAQLIRASGTDVFIDLENIPFGVRWKDVIEQRINSSRTILIFWGRNAAESEYVKTEYLAALSTPNARLVPIMLDNTPLPAALSEYQAHTGFLPLLQQQGFRQDLTVLTTKTRKAQRPKKTFLILVLALGALLAFGIVMTMHFRSLTAGPSSFQIVEIIAFLALLALPLLILVIAIRIILSFIRKRSISLQIELIKKRWNPPLPLNPKGTA